MILGAGLAVGVGSGVTSLVEGRQGTQSFQSLKEGINEYLEMLEKSINALEKSMTSL